MRMPGIRIPLLVLGACALASPVHAQHEQHQSQSAGMEHSEIPSLTSQEIDDLRSGAGMGLAKVAELNHYPGPSHAIELAEDIGLTDEQMRDILEIQSAMRERAIELGEAIIDAERDLDLCFKHGQLDEEGLSSVTRDIALLYGELRFAHLRAHLAMRSVLSDGQIADYDRLRGYARE